MIRCCEDIKTMDDFKKFAKYRGDAMEVGLEETANMLCWNEFTVMNSDLFDRLFEERLREAKQRLKND